jgi:multidrug resistance efflux pump
MTDNSQAGKLAPACLRSASEFSVSYLYYAFPRTDHAYVRANIVGIAPHVSGPITELAVQDNQFVRHGQLLFVVDPRPYRSAVDKAEADVSVTELEIRALDNSIRAANARQAQLQADVAYDQQYLRRILPLLTRHFMTENDVFNARTRLEAAEAAVTSARSEVAKAQNELGQVGRINARRKSAEALLYDANLNVEYCYVRAPFDAYVTNLNIAVGQYANEGKEVLSLVDDRTWYVLANFRENFLGTSGPKCVRRSTCSVIQTSGSTATCKVSGGLSTRRMGRVFKACPKWKRL